MNSRHLPGSDGLSYAVDIYPWVEGQTSHASKGYNRVAKAMFAAAMELNIYLEWGGFWNNPDKPHWQLSAKKYPKT
jgi:hypothetical protein